MPPEKNQKLAIYYSIDLFLPADEMLSKFGVTMTHFNFPTLRCLLTSRRPRTIRLFALAYKKKSIMIKCIFY